MGWVAKTLAAGMRTRSNPLHSSLQTLSHKIIRCRCMYVCGYALSTHLDLYRRFQPVAEPTYADLVLSPLSLPSVFFLFFFPLSSVLKMGHFTVHV